MAAGRSVLAMTGGSGHIRLHCTSHCAMMYAGEFSPRKKDAEETCNGRGKSGHPDI
jgi:hypothetical protein